MVDGETENLSDAVAFVRVSTNEQAIKGLSLDEQEESVPKYLESLSYKVEKIFRGEGESGSKEQDKREVFQEVITYCEEHPNIKAVGVLNTDRFARDEFVHHLVKRHLKKLGVRLISVTQPMIDDTPEGQLIDGVMASVNAYQSRDTARKTKRNLEKHAEDGWFPSPAPQPYQNTTITENGRERHIITLDEKLAVYYRQIPPLYKSDLSFRAISKKLYGEGLRGRLGGRVSPEAIREFLFSPFPLGWFEWGGKLYKGNHPPLWTEYEVEEARNRSKELGHPHPSKHDDFFYRKLKIRCAKCGCLVTAELHIKHYPRTGRTVGYIYYHCSKSKGNCGQPFISEIDLEKEFGEKVIAPIDLPKEAVEYIMENLNGSYAETEKERQTVIENLNRRLGQLQSQEDTLLTLLLEKKISQEIYDERLKLIKSERGGINQKLSELENSQNNWIEESLNLLKACQDAKNKFWQAEKPERVEFLQLLSLNLFLKDRKVIVTHQMPFDVVAKYASRPNWLERWDDYRTTDWANHLEYPEFTTKEVNRFLSL